VYAAFSNINRNLESEHSMAMKAQNETDQAATEDTTLPNLRFDKKWKGTFRFEKVKTVITQGIDGEPFAYPLITVTVVDPGNTGTTVDSRYLVHAYPETLIAELRRVKPQAGATLTIKYQGETETKSKRKVKVFEIDSPDTADINWDNPGF